jgi:excisionase family DNA binding protein
MSLIDEHALRAIIAEEIAKALRGGSNGNGEVERSADEYLPVARAARLASVASATIRAWIKDGRLRRYHAGRELRVLRAELDGLLRTRPRASSASLTPEDAADALIERRRHHRSRPGRRS